MLNLLNLCLRIVVNVVRVMHWSVTAWGRYPLISKYSPQITTKSLVELRSTVRAAHVCLCQCQFLSPQITVIFSTFLSVTVGILMWPHVEVLVWICFRCENYSITQSQVWWIFFNDALKKARQHHGCSDIKLNFFFSFTLFFFCFT